MSNVIHKLANDIDLLRKEHSDSQKQHNETKDDVKKLRDALETTELKLVTAERDLQIEKNRNLALTEQMNQLMKQLQGQNETNMRQTIENIATARPIELAQIVQAAHIPSSPDGGDGSASVSNRNKLMDLLSSGGARIVRWWNGMPTWAKVGFIISGVVFVVGIVTVGVGFAPALAAGATAAAFATAEAAVATACVAGVVAAEATATAVAVAGAALGVGAALSIAGGVMTSVGTAGVAITVTVSKRDSCCAEEKQKLL